jgi:hypothetical protein
LSGFAGEALERAGFRYASIDYKDYLYAEPAQAVAAMDKALAARTAFP